MSRLSILTLMLLMLPSMAAAQQPTSPPPFAYGTANTWNGTSNPYAPGDEHGAIGRTYAVLKANDQFSFFQRPLGAGSNPLPTGMPISDTAFFASVLPGSSVIFPGGSSPTGVVNVTPNGDGRVFYDPYSPCGDGVGRWIVVEMGNLTQANGVTNSAILVAISNG